MLDFIKTVSAGASREQKDLFSGCSTSQEITDSFSKALSEAIAESQDVKPYIVPSDACQGVFAQIDTSRDGYLSQEEAIKALMPVVEDEEIAQKIYSVLDPSGKGQVSQEQFESCLDTVIKVTSFEASLNITEVTQVAGFSSDAGSFEGILEDMRSQDGISGKPISTGGFSVDAFWMKLLDELDKKGAKPSASTEASQEGDSSVSSGGQAMTMGSMTYAEASISVETVSANLGAVFSAMA
ncbi:MAG: EF-hand domain-containing protein [Alphaproteobacteria bacterium]|nr:EF-hand domain-containing protein [Alphaproteobacteria bacterium]